MGAKDGFMNDELGLRNLENMKRIVKEVCGDLFEVHYDKYDPSKTYTVYSTSLGVNTRIRYEWGADLETCKEVILAALVSAPDRNTDADRDLRFRCLELANGGFEVAEDCYSFITKKKVYDKLSDLRQAAASRSPEQGLEITEY